MRCLVCDYCPSVGSVYNHMTTNSFGNKLKWSLKESGYVCAECETISREALSEMILPDEEVVFNSPSFQTKT